MNRFQLVDRVEELESELGALRASFAFLEERHHQLEEKYARAKQGQGMGATNVAMFRAAMERATQHLLHSGDRDHPAYYELRKALLTAPSLLSEVQLENRIQRELSKVLALLAEAHEEESPERLIDDCIAEAAAKERELLKTQRKANSRRRKALEEEFPEQLSSQ